MQHLHSVFILFLVVQVTLLNSQKTKCAGGRVLSGGKCIDCPPGTYRPWGTPNVCVKCPPGRYSSLKGVGAKRLCRFCPENTFADKPGSTECKPCSENTVSSGGVPSCQACGPGFELIYNRCSPCEEGYFNNKTASLYCDRCPESGPKGATSIKQCKACPPGRSGSDCHPCLKGTFKPAGVIGSCEDCPQGSVATPGFVGCQKCPAGTFSRKVFREKCKPCPKGTTSNGPGAGFCRVVGSQTCPSDTFENANGDCEKCTTGFFHNVRTNFCDRCPLGSVSKGGFQKECTKCPPGQKTDGDHEQECRCTQGLYKAKDGTCKLCPAGTVGNFGNVFGRGGCSKCIRGSYSSERGSMTCQLCPVGTFSAEQGARRCKKCPRGFTSNAASPGNGGSTYCVFIRTGCPQGSGPARNVFGDRICKRRVCQVGTPEKDIGFLCTPCKPGFFLTAGKCKPCPKDTVSPGGIITSCTKCKNGLAPSLFDSSKCACDGTSGAGKGIQDGFCKDCPPGTISGASISNCRPCSLGFFATGTGNRFCIPCPSGTVADVVGTAVCKPCPKGTVPAQTIGAKDCVRKA